MQGIAILGSTGSIGTQALEVIAANPELLKPVVLTAHRNTTLLIEQARRFVPNWVVITDTAGYPTVKAALADLPIQVAAGSEALNTVVTLPEVQTVLTAMVGFAGFAPTVAAITAQKKIALANKETLVVAGELITTLAQQHQVEIIPVDSEHSAIFQCLVGEKSETVSKIILTASGGPFRGKTLAELAHIKPEQALKHPNWSMGAKITIDSATLVNKGLEIIEAKWLFDLNADQIEVVVHPQSVIHSLIEFKDGSIKAQLGRPDMHIPIHYALHYPNRKPLKTNNFNFIHYPTLTFEPPDRKTFKAIDIAFECLAAGGNRPCVFNAANEIAVSAFLAGKIGFLDIYHYIEYALEKIDYQTVQTFEALIAADQQTRKLNYPQPHFR
jgi:1-deoxy-D-xylulose-5-phosphate reductoisomerase